MRRASTQLSASVETRRDRGRCPAQEKKKKKEK